jgi:hypothetical protein
MIRTATVAKEVAMRLRMLITVVGLLVAAHWAARAEHSGDAGSKPLILEKNEGEHRVRRPRGTQIAGLPFIIKVDRKNGACCSQKARRPHWPRLLTGWDVWPYRKWQQRRTRTPFSAGIGNSSRINLTDRDFADEQDGRGLMRKQNV